MRKPLFLVMIGAGLLGGTAAARPHRPVVVELFTAQGCAHCPQADRMLADLADRKGLVALTLPVDYWDYLGWADTFATPANTERQRAYARRLKVREIYTPQIVVDGAGEASGLDKDAVTALIAAGTGQASDGPRVRLLYGRVRVEAGRTGAPRADVWLVRYDPQEHAVRVNAGDNKGKLVAERDVVRELTRLGGYSGGVRSYVLPKATAEGLATVVLVQGVRGGRIVGVSGAAPS